MSSNVINQAPFLRTSRSFPEDLHEMSVEVNKSYVDIANAVNNRTISLFPTTRPALNGESWFIDQNRRQQGFRQIYAFTSTAANIAHNIQNYTQIPYFTEMRGQYTDGTNWYGLFAAANVAIAGQITFYITSTDIVFVIGAGAPALTKGIIVLEWISNV